MVVIHMKRTDEQQFLYETTVTASVRDTVRELVEIHNLRLRIERLKLEGGELAQFGPAKHPEKQARKPPLYFSPPLTWSSVLLMVLAVPSLPCLTLTVLIRFAPSCVRLPAPPPQGLDEFEKYQVDPHAAASSSGAGPAGAKERGPYYKSDPTGRRTGEGERKTAATCSVGNMAETPLG